ncbi:VOC family protein [Luteimicrobium sp. NPDC057192]|uniref:VOC family protein n=1 Tax=Luteimicrobium sp. NPDC057192 TaxID=3346042 RepID=UPI003637B9E1
MALTTTTHLNFAGTACAALELYRTVFGGDVHVTTYAQLGMPQDAPDAAKVVFGRLETPGGLRLMAYDVPGGSRPARGSARRENGLTVTDQPFFVSVRAERLDEAASCWEGLADGATVVEPLAASAWSPGFGMLTDRFGVTWVIDVASPAVG